MTDIRASKTGMGQSRTRLWALLFALALALLGTVATHRQQIATTWRASVLPAPRPHCDRAAPQWLTEIGNWAHRHDLPGVQIHLRLGQETFNCTFGKTITASGARRPMDANVVLPYASLTKVVTSALVVMQAQQGTLDLGRPIYEALHLDRYDVARPERWRAITIEHLLGHRGGFRRAASGDPMFWPQAPCPSHPELLKRVRVDFQPGSDYAYSNLGYCLLGILLHNVTGASFSELVATDVTEGGLAPSIRITNALDLKAADTGLYFSTTYERQAFESLDWEVHATTGGLAGTAQDFGRILFALATASDSRLGQAGRVLLQPLPHCDDAVWRSCHGLAFYSHQESGGARMFWRDGSLPGVSAFAAVSASGDVFVLLGNSREPDWMPSHDELGQILYGHLAGLDRTQGKADLREAPLALAPKQTSD